MDSSVPFYPGDIVIIPDNDVIEFYSDETVGENSIIKFKVADYLNMPDILFHKKYDTDFDRSLKNRLCLRTCRVIQLIDYKSGNWWCRFLPFVNIDKIDFGEENYSLNKYPLKKFSSTKNWIKVTPQIVFESNAQNKDYTCTYSFDRWYPIKNISFNYKKQRLLPDLELFTPDNNWDKNTYVWWQTYCKHDKKLYCSCRKRGKSGRNCACRPWIYPEHLDETIFLPFAPQMNVEDTVKLKGEGPGWLIKIHQDNWVKIRDDGIDSLVHFQNENYSHLDTYRENSFDYFYVPMAHISFTLHCPVAFDESLSVLGKGIPC